MNRRPTTSASSRAAQPLRQPRNRGDPTTKQCPLHYFVIKCGVLSMLLFWVAVVYVQLGNFKEVTTKDGTNPNLRSSTTQEGSQQAPQDRMHQVANAAFEKAESVFREAQKDAMLLAETAKKKEHELMSRYDGTSNVSGGENDLDTEGNDSIEPVWEHDATERPGFVVLGMHRSGTSMLSGLLVTGLGYKTGGPLIGPAFDNAKGFFERVDVVLQNDAFMHGQKVDWANSVISYDADKALDQMKNGRIKFDEYGKPGLAFLNDAANQPWLQKDPRMCITLKTWIPLLNAPPAVLFTYRHPLEVAMSLNKREGNFPLERGLRLWIVYNMRAIQNAQGQCIVYSSNEKVLKDTFNEVQRISDQLTQKCNVPAPSKKLTQKAVEVFVDPTLRHNNKNDNIEDLEEGQILERHGDCIVPRYESEKDEGSIGQQREEELYKKAMKIYCDLKTGDAYRDDYVWPPLS